MDIKLACTHDEDFLTYQYIFPWLKNNAIRCEVCREQISGDSYTCQKCEVRLHESCASQLLLHLPHKITHPLHSQHQLELQLVRSCDFICDKCLYICAGSRYNCSSCDFNLDLTCASSVDDPLPEKGWHSFKGEKKNTIQHYSHNHKLTIFKYRKIKELEYNCSWCGKRPLVSDVCYGCIHCKFFLHEVCTDKIPKTLNHPFHPSDPLRLHYMSAGIGENCHACGGHIHFLYGTGYSCQMCNFNLDFRCAKLSPTLKLKFHDHLLAYFGKICEKSRKYFQCTVCKMLCDANFYRCVQCDFTLHLQCASVPSSTKHKYHRHPLILMDSVKEDDSGEYYCDVCENERNPDHPVYCCEKCTYIVHIECILHEDLISSEEVTSPAPPSMDSKALTVKEFEHNEGTEDIQTFQQILIRPLIHEHPMKFYGVVENSKENLYCNGCRLELSGPSYICTESHLLDRKNCFLHERCANLANEIQHPFHSSHPLNLYARYRYETRFYSVCDVCRDFAFGFVYLCEECDFTLDVKCAINGVSRLKDQMERVTELHHFTHRHKLTLANFSDPLKDTVCSICQLSLFGAVYFCLPCYYVIHEYCLGFPQKLQVPFHLEHTLVFGIRWGKCYACRLGGVIAYNCEQCDVKLHTLCANYLSRPLKYASHMYNLYYFGRYCQLFFEKHLNRRRAPLFYCVQCRKNCTGKPFYRCLEYDFNFHLECIFIPHTVKSKCHVHPLVLKDSFIEDDSEEYYYDICEEERCQIDHVYCCEECDGRLVAHIECVLVEVEQVLSYLDPQERKESPIHETADSPSEMMAKGKKIQVPPWSYRKNNEIIQSHDREELQMQKSYVVT